MLNSKEFYDLITEFEKNFNRLSPSHAAARAADGAKEWSIESEKLYFNRVVEYCTSAENANKFAAG